MAFRRANYELISILKKRGIFKDVLMNGIGSQNIDHYLNKKCRSIYSILKLEDHRLSFSSLATLFPLFIVQQLGHRPVLILDDREALDENIEQTIHDALRIFKRHVDHFLLPKYHKSNRHLYDFHQIVILKMSDIIPKEPNLKSFLSTHSELQLEMLDKTKSIYDNYKSICQADDIRNEFKFSVVVFTSDCYYLNSYRHINTILGSNTQISNEFDELSLNILEAMDVPHKVITIKHVDIPKSSQVQLIKIPTILILYIRYS